MSVLTREEIFREYAKCLQSPAYAIENYIQTFDMTQKGFVPFKLFIRQKEILQAYQKYRFNLVTKPRQAGISTTTQAYCAVKAAFADDSNPETIVVIANKLTLAKKFTKGIKDSQIEIELPNGSKIVAVATSKDALRGYTPTLLIVVEAAFVDNGAELYGAAMSSLSTGGGAILISTPNGYDALYYKTYEQSLQGLNDYNIIELYWYQDPRYNKDLKWLKGDEVILEYEFKLESFARMIKAGYKPTSTWYVDTCKLMNNDKKRIAQELDVSFLGSGGNVIDDEYIEFHKLNNVKDPKFVDKTYFDGNSGFVWVWEEPIEGHQYIMAADVSRGDGSDFSVFTILDFTTMEQVAEYQGKVAPDMFSEILNKYGLLYNAYLVIDNIGIGNTTVSKMIELKYPNLHHDEVGEKKTPGFNINGVRLNLIANLEIAVRTNTIKIRSNRVTSEMKTFIYRNGRPDHMEGYHDDTILALGMALWILESSFKKLEKLEKQTKAILSSWVTSNPSNTSPTTSVFDDKKKELTKKINPQHRAYRNVQDPTGQYMWLFGK